MYCFRRSNTHQKVHRAVSNVLQSIFAKSEKYDSHFIKIVKYKDPRGPSHYKDVVLPV